MDQIPRGGIFTFPLASANQGVLYAEDAFRSWTLHFPEWQRKWDFCRNLRPKTAEIFTNGGEYREIAKISATKQQGFFLTAEIF